MIQLTYEYRLYPNRKQQEQIKRTFNAVRYIYNKLLEERASYFRENGKWKRMDKLDMPAQPFLEGIDPGALNMARSRLERAYKHFFHTERTVPDKYREDSIAASKRDPGYKLMDTDLVSYPRYKKKKTS